MIPNARDELSLSIQSNDAEPPASLSTRELICLAAIVLFALVIRAALAPVESPWFDEVVTLKHLDASSLPNFLKLVRADDPASQPLYMVAQYGWGQVFGPGYLAQRWFSILLAEISLILIFLIGRRLEGPTTGLLAALGLAASSFHIEYSLEIRVYMLTFVWALLSVHSLLRLLEAQTPLRWCIHLGSTIALVWTHPFGVFIFPVEGLAWFIWGPRSWKQQAAWLVGQGLVSASVVIWILDATQGGVQQAASWLPMPTFWLNDFSLSISLIGTWYIWLVSADYHTGLTDIRNLVPMIVYGGMSVTALILAGLQLRKKLKVHDESVTPGLMIWLVLWWVIPCLLVYGLSHAWQPAFFPRYVLYCIVPPFMLSGWAVAQIPSKRWKSGVIGVMVITALAMGFFNSRKPYRAPWIPILAHVEPGELILYSQSPEGNRMAFNVVEYLAHTPLQIQGLTSSDSLAAYIQNRKVGVQMNIVLIGSEPLESLNSFILDAGYNMVIETYPSRTPLTLYTIRR
jgi:uncharacterized membrane protein